MESDQVADKLAAIDRDLRSLRSTFGIVIIILIVLLAMIAPTLVRLMWDTQSRPAPGQSVMPGLESPKAPAASAATTTKAL